MDVEVLNKVSKVFYDYKRCIVLLVKYLFVIYMYMYSGRFEILLFL